MVEVEVKIPVGDLKEVRAGLLKAGFVHAWSRIEKDTYFDGGANGIRKSGQALRVRQILDCDTGEKKAEINFKGKKIDSVSMSRPEYETSVGDGETAGKILLEAGFFPVKPAVIKKREMLVCGEMTACLDEVEGLGTFLELEILADDESGRDPALRKIEAILTGMGFAMEDTTRVSYLTQLMRKECPFEKQD
ncbi:MAG: class IV adenylate cyclase [Lachnospiraceae bacterium]|nr:class IV adenylate cyclase [Lachnospiraceae bacterium]